MAALAEDTVDTIIEDNCYIATILLKVQGICVPLSVERKCSGNTTV